MILKIHMYIVISIESQQQKYKITEYESFAVAASGYMVNSMIVSAHLNNVRCTTKTINTFFMDI